VSRLPCRATPERAWEESGFINVWLAGLETVKKVEIQTAGPLLSVRIRFLVTTPGAAVMRSLITKVEPKRHVHGSARSASTSATLAISSGTSSRSSSSAD